MNDDKFQNPQTPQDTTRQSSKVNRRIVMALFVLSVTVVAIIFAVWTYQQDTVDNNGSLATPGSVKNDGNKIATDAERSISEVVKKVSPSVVSITTKSQSRTSFYTQQGAGTGVIVSKDGIVMTNHHVVGKGGNISIVLSDGELYEEVELIGSDPLNDIAFLKIKGAKDLKPATLGDSSTVRVGQEVVAIGNSLGQYQNTVTTGILSATGRPITAQDGNSVESLTDLLQTDAAINPGNSGGPLLNLSGQVIGINTAVAEDAQGIGFAIPINATKGILKGVLAGKGILRSYAGVSYISITPEVARHYNLPVREGAYIYRQDNVNAVSKGSPAEKSGIKNGDIITAISGQKVGSDGGLSSLIGQYAPGETIEVTVLRGEEIKTFRLTLGTYRD